MGGLACTIPFLDATLWKQEVGRAARFGEALGDRAGEMMALFGIERDVLDQAVVLMEVTITEPVGNLLPAGEVENVGRTGCHQLEGAAAPGAGQAVGAGADERAVLHVDEFLQRELVHRQDPVV